MSFHSAPVRTTCNAVAAAVFGAAAVLTVMFPNANPLHPFLFATGAIAFALNLERTLSPIAFAVAALVELACLFELLGFTVGMTLMARAGIISEHADEWWVSPALWGLLTICSTAFVLSAFARRAE